MAFHILLFMFVKIFLLQVVKNDLMAVRSFMIEIEAREKIQ